ncbi:hypothetical protein [uncultured Kordia sp.]|uniref:hypothetical protein n=1 Tax=uncultured Kordia sp. TaxID=507699 RepID=UPI002606C51C|nr:hypothetical protein [uncultured Kordia sp.]
MKKKNLKNLILQKYRVSNLTLLYRKVGGYTPADASETETYINTTDASVDGANCTAVDQSGSPDCPSFVYHSCHTNDGSTRAKPPSEHEGCQAGGNGNAMHAG